jgi:Protein of unknown function (DUF3501)
MTIDTRARHKCQLTRADIVPPAEYAAMRSEQRKRITEIKRRRRTEVGPFATFYFENYETMRHQVHEMLHIEQGGEAQIEDELTAYNPLIPQGKELVATVMFEIDDPSRRASVLARLGGIENQVFLDIAGQRIRGEPDPTRESTSPEGKASSVQFLRFPSSELQAHGGAAGAGPRCFGRRLRLRGGQAPERLVGSAAISRAAPAHRPGGGAVRGWAPALRRSAWSLRPARPRRRLETSACLCAPTPPPNARSCASARAG